MLKSVVLLGPYVSASAVLVITVELVYSYTPFCVASTWFLTRIRVPTTATLAVSIVVNAPVVVNVAPTPAVPLLYVTVPPVAAANVPVVAATTAA